MRSGLQPKTIMYDYLIVIDSHFTSCCSLMRVEEAPSSTFILTESHRRFFSSVAKNRRGGLVGVLLYGIKSKHLNEKPVMVDVLESVWGEIPRKNVVPSSTQPLEAQKILPTGITMTS